MSAARPKPVFFRSEATYDQGAPMDWGRSTPPIDPPVSRTLSEAVQSIAELRSRCEAAEVLAQRDAAAHARSLNEVQSTITRKQQRINALESLMEEFKGALQELLKESALHTGDYRESERKRLQLAALVAERTDEVAALHQRCQDLEGKLRKADDRHQVQAEFAARHIEGLKLEELESAASGRKIRQSREEMERLFIAAAPTGYHPTMD